MSRFSLFLGFLLMVQMGFSQVRIGLRAGITTTSINDETLNIFDDNGVEDLQLGLRNARYGVHGGLVLQAQFNKFVLQPEVLLNSNRTDYRLTDLTTGDTTLFTEKYQYLDIPVLFGFSFKPLRLQVGPVGHVYLNSTSDLRNFSGYEEDFQRLTLGWQASIGLDIWKLMLDFRYEGNFDNYGDHFAFFGRDYAFSQRASRLLFSLGFRLGKNR